jgi:adenylate cyclase
MQLFEKHVAPETAKMIWQRKAEIFQQGELEPQEITATVLFIGDAIMAVFGVPFSHSQEKDIQQDAINAIAACIDMHASLAELNQKLVTEGKPLIKFGIGLHTGQMVAGSVGGGKGLNYSVISDAVNVAARLEAMNKNITSDSPYNLLLTEKTLRTKISNKLLDNIILLPIPRPDPPKSQKLLQTITRRLIM